MLAFDAPSLDGGETQKELVERGQYSCNLAQLISNAVIFQVELLVVLVEETLKLFLPNLGARKFSPPHLQFSASGGILFI